MPDSIRFYAVPGNAGIPMSMQCLQEACGMAFPFRFFGLEPPGRRRSRDCAALGEDARSSGNSRNRTACPARGCVFRVKAIIRK